MYWHNSKKKDVSLIYNVITIGMLGVIKTRKATLRRVLIISKPLIEFFDTVIEQQVEGRGGLCLLTFIIHFVL